MRKLNWKKVIAGTLSTVMLLSVTACGSANGKNGYTQKIVHRRKSHSAWTGHRIPTTPDFM